MHRAFPFSVARSAGVSNREWESPVRIHLKFLSDHLEQFCARRAVFADRPVSLDLATHRSPGCPCQEMGLSFLTGPIEATGNAAPERYDHSGSDQCAEDWHILDLWFALDTEMEEANDQKDRKQAHHDRS